MLEQIVRGPLLLPQDDGRVVFHADGALASDGDGILRFAGPWEQLHHHVAAASPARRSEGVMLPPLIDIHIHIPQHPIRGRFVEGIAPDVAGGRLLAGLKRNVFPAEALCADAEHAQRVVERFRADTLSHGVVAGAAYMTPSVLATEIALSQLPEPWSVGLVLMNQNCPADLRTDELNLERDVARLAKRFGRRLIVTDRFAVAVDSPLRRRGAALAERLALRTQTHLNEQQGEKEWVETGLYPQTASYTDVYHRDGLLDHQCIVAHCVHMRESEWKLLADSGSSIAHCPTSNFALGSGVMSLEAVLKHKIPFAIATDVGASPTVSMLAEMGRFLQMQAAGSALATPAQALFRATLAPAKILGLHQQLGILAAGRPMSFIEVRGQGADAEEVIRSLIPADLDNPAPAVNRVTVGGRVVFQRKRPDA
jgi:guanine deaminase